MGPGQAVHPGGRRRAEWWDRPPAAQDRTHADRAAGTRREPKGSATASRRPDAAGASSRTCRIEVDVAPSWRMRASLVCHPGGPPRGVGALVGSSEVPPPRRPQRRTRRASRTSMSNRCLAGCSAWGRCRCGHPQDVTYLETCAVQLHHGFQSQRRGCGSVGPREDPGHCAGCSAPAPVPPGAAGCDRKRHCPVELPARGEMRGGVPRGTSAPRAGGTGAACDAGDGHRSRMACGRLSLGEVRGHSSTGGSTWNRALGTADGPFHVKRQRFDPGR